VDENGCWIWTGRTIRNGYGFLWRANRRFSTHRLSYELHVGPIPTGMDLDHLCSNPPCCNPAHLEPVTHAENMRRMAERGRSARGERSAHAVLTEDQVVEITERLDRGESKRQLSSAYGITWQSVHAVDRGLSWQWLTGRSKPPRFRHPSRKRTAEVLRLIGEGRSGAEIAAELGIAQSTVSRIRNQRTDRAREASVSRNEST
jgi:hypothetical protein